MRVAVQCGCHDVLAASASASAEAIPLLRARGASGAGTPSANRETSGGGGGGGGPCRQALDARTGTTSLPAGAATAPAESVAASAAAAAVVARTPVASGSGSGGYNAGDVVVRSETVGSVRVLPPQRGAAEAASGASNEDGRRVIRMESAPVAPRSARSTRTRARSPVVTAAGSSRTNAARASPAYSPQTMTTTQVHHGTPMSARVPGLQSPMGPLPPPQTSSSVVMPAGMAMPSMGPGLPLSVPGPPQSPRGPQALKAPALLVVGSPVTVGLGLPPQAVAGCFFPRP